MSSSTTVSSPSRRSFLGRLGRAAAVTSTIGLTPVFGATSTNSGTAPAGPVNRRVAQSLLLRVTTATKEAAIPVPPHTTNGDEQLYPDKSASYSKALLQDGYGRVNLNAYNSLITALNSGNPSDFENIILGGTVNGRPIRNRGWFRSGRYRRSAVRQCSLSGQSGKSRGCPSASGGRQRCLRNGIGGALLGLAITRRGLY